jgi:DNA polymerase III alpha subunit
MVSAARALVGRPCNLGVHTSGIVLTAEPVEGLVPVQRGPGNVRLSQFNKDAVEAVGLVKIDLLSNRALSTLAEARQHLQSLSPEDATRPAEDGDPATLALLAKGDTLGISHLETPGMRRLLRQLEPKGLGDLAQALAVSRPGVASAGGKETYLRRRHGLEPTRYAHATLEPILRETCGVLLYEDDALSVVEALTGLPASEADRIRRRIADSGTAAEATAWFLAACERNGVPKSAVEVVAADLQKFELYSFCKAHATSVGLIAWQEAFLKARHPVAFWCAALYNHQGIYPRRVHVEAAKRSGLTVYLPCVNRSQSAFSQEVAGIRTGLGSIRSLSTSALQAVQEEREKGGPFASVNDFRRRLVLSSQDLALLIRAGSLDVFGRGRLALLREVDAVKGGRLPPWWREEDVEPWPGDGFATGHPLEPQWKGEWELLGFWAGGTPLMHLVRSWLPHDFADSRSLLSLAGERVRVAGLVAHARSVGGEDSEPTRFVTLEDEWGLVEVVASQSAGETPPGPLLVAEGRVEQRYGVPVVAASKLERPLPGAAPRAAWVPAAHRNGVAAAS